MTVLTAPADHSLRERRRLLGYAGLLPFVACLAGSLLLPQAEWRAQAASAMVHYAALIATFLGAVHWGVPGGEKRDRQQARLVWGVIPAIVSWVLLQLPAEFALTAFAILFLLIMLVDRHLLPLLDIDYRALRLRLSVAVVALLVLGAFLAGDGI